MTLPLQTTTFKASSRTYAQKVAEAIIDDWKDRPAYRRLKRGRERWVITLLLDAHLYPEAEKELASLLSAAGLEFSTNQVYSGGKIQKQTNIIHIQRMEP